ncbi:DUF4393 domain-containing protein [Lacticaseibacillus zhaodongensis]|uniref:DUF4393 domain-containing protein n=1 Tax=Lacticaseibacillus zhaodongensis TaxID=2668065 RepID=UPI0012D3233B|nr:DUF4393 domain-containing protein [Lacticaseibacillus zhaodongensis]
MEFADLVPALMGMAGGTLTRAIEVPMKQLDDWWFVHFGSKTELERQKQEFLNQQKLTEFKQEILDQVKQIPPEDITEPNKAILGPTIEASKYYIDDDSLRKMFAKLFASSVDSRLENKTRSAFVEFVKQFSPVDAQLLKIIVQYGNTIPLAQIKIVYTDDSFVINRTNVVAPEISIRLNDNKQIASSIDNLNRLGLISVTYMFYKRIDYKVFESTIPYKETQLSVEQRNKQLSDLLSSEAAQNIRPEVKKELVHEQNARVDIEKGKADLTSLGKDFTQVVL